MKSEAAATCHCPATAGAARSDGGQKDVTELEWGMPPPHAPPLPPQLELGKPPGFDG